MEQTDVEMEQEDVLHDEYEIIEADQEDEEGRRDG